MQSEDHPQQLLGNMGHGNLMGLPLSPFLGVKLSENRFVGNKWKAAVEKGTAEMRRAMLNHVAGGFRLAGLEIAGFQAGEGEHLGRILELAEITVLREDDGGGRSSNAGDGEHGRVNTTDTFFDLVIQFLHLGVQLRVEFQQDGHFLEKEAGRTANGVLCQGLEFDKVIEREVSPRDFTKGFIRACVHAGDSFRRLVVVKDVQRCGGELSLEKGFEFGKHLVQNVGQLHQLAGTLADEAAAESCQ